MKDLWPARFTLYENVSLCKIIVKGNMPFSLYICIKNEIILLYTLRHDAVIMITKP